MIPSRETCRILVIAILCSGIFSSTKLFADNNLLIQQYNSMQSSKDLRDYREACTRGDANKCIYLGEQAAARSDSYGARSDASKYYLKACNLNSDAACKTLENEYGITVKGRSGEETGAGEGRKLPPETRQKIILGSGKRGGAERIIGYQTGIYHVFNTESCNSPTIRSYGLTDFPLKYINSIGSLSILYTEAVWWVRSLCKVPNNQTVRIGVNFHVAGESVAILLLSDRKFGANNESLWWADRINLLGVEVTDIENGGRLTTNFLDLLAATLLDQNPVERRRAAARLVEFDLNTLQDIDNSTVALELARIQSDRIDLDIEALVQGSGSLYFDEDGKGVYCSSSPAAMQRAADLGNSIAAFLVARCQMNLQFLAMGHDLKSLIAERAESASVRESSDEIYLSVMFHLAKAMIGGYAPAYGLAETLGGYEEELIRFASVVAEHGLQYSFADYTASVEPNSTEFISPPSKAEARMALNEQILLRNCSRLGIVLGSGGSALDTALFSSVEPKNGWCVTTNIGMSMSLRFGPITDLQCAVNADGGFSCSTNYHVECGIDSFESTKAGNRAICSILEQPVVGGIFYADRTENGNIEIVKFKANGNKIWLK